VDSCGFIILDGFVVPGQGITSRGGVRASKSTLDREEHEKMTWREKDFEFVFFITVLIHFSRLG
jgi:hypothetical protein